MPPRLHITSDDPEFDPVLLSHWKAEGFDATYLQYKGDPKAFKNTIFGLSEELELGESFAMVGMYFCCL